MGIGTIFGMMLLAAPVLGATDTYFIAGRVNLAQDAPAVAGVSRAGPRVASHRFELTLSLRQGRFAGSELCIFAVLGHEESAWEGTCFRPEPSRMQAAFEPAAFSTAVGHTDPAAQKLLRFLMQESYQHLPGSRRVVGFDIDAPLEVKHEKFVEADL